MNKIAARCRLLLVVITLMMAGNSYADAVEESPSMPKKENAALLNGLRSKKHLVKIEALKSFAQLLQQGKIDVLPGKDFTELLEAAISDDLEPEQGGELGGAISSLQSRLFAEITKSRIDQSDELVKLLLDIASDKENRYHQSAAIAAIAEVSDERTLQSLIDQAVADAKNNVKESPSARVLDKVGWKIVLPVINYFYRTREPSETKLVAQIFKRAVGAEAATAILDQEIKVRKEKQNLPSVQQIDHAFLPFLGKVDMYRFVIEEKGLIELRAAIQNLK